MITKEEADGKVDAGWLRAWMTFEALAMSEEVSKKSLENFIEKLEKDGRAKIYKKEFLPAKKMENPLPNIPEGWSVVSNIELVSRNLDHLAQIVIEYGPSSAEILEPQNMKIDVGEAQNILNTIADMMHRFASAGVGGAILLKGKE